MTGTKTPILHGVCQGDFDLAGWKLLNANLSDLASGAPFSDNTGLIRSADEATALAHFKLDWTTPGVHREFTLPNYDAQLATLDGAEALINKSYNGLSIDTTTGELDIEDDASVVINGNLLFEGPFTLSGGFLTTFEVTGITDLILPTSGTLATTAQLPTISDVAYDATSWNGNLDGATKNAIRDKIEGLLTPPFSDANNILTDSGRTPSPFVKFDLGDLTVGVTRTLTVPNKDGTLAMLDDVPDTAGIIFSADEIDRQLYIAANVAFFAGFTLTGGLTTLESPPGGTDLVLPASGTLATVAGTIPSSYLDNNTDLGGTNAAADKVPTQKAVKTYVDALAGVRIEPDNDGQVNSGTVVDLVGLPYQLEVLGTSDIQAFTMETGDEHVLVFEGELTLINSVSLILPGGEDILTAAGDYAVIHGLVGGVSKVSRFQKAVGHVADIVGGSVEHITRLGFASGETGFQLLLSVPATLTNNRTLTIDPVNGNRVLTLASDFTTAGSFPLTLTQTATTNVTLPTTGTVEAYVGVPASAAAAGVAGQKAYAAGFEYRCVATNTWQRVAIATW